MMIHYLTDIEVTSHRQLGTNWGVQSLLAEVARSTSPPFHALIDGGALVTGMTNVEVARYLNPAVFVLEWERFHTSLGYDDPYLGRNGFRATSVFADKTFFMIASSPPVCVCGLIPRIDWKRCNPEYVTIVAADRRGI